MKNNILTDTLLYDALEIYNNEWVTSEDFSKEKFETSEKFNKKMQKMIKSRSNIYYKATLTGLRRAVYRTQLRPVLLILRMRGALPARKVPWGRRNGSSPGQSSFPRWLPYGSHRPD